MSKEKEKFDKNGFLIEDEDTEEAQEDIQKVEVNDTEKEVCVKDLGEKESEVSEVETIEGKNFVLTEEAREIMKNIPFEERGVRLYKHKDAETGEEVLCEVAIRREHLDSFDYLVMIMNSLNENFNSTFLKNRKNEEIIDKMHSELVEYKRGFIDKAAESYIFEIIHLIDSNSRTAELFDELEFSEENYKKILGQIKGLNYDLKDILYRHNIEEYRLEDDTIDVKKQEIVGKEITTDKDLVNKRAKTIASGYHKDGEIIRKERVSIYKEESGEDK